MTELEHPSLASMKLIALYVSLLVSSVASAEETTLSAAVSEPNCLRSIDQYVCTGSDYGQGLVDIALQCGPDYISLYAETQAAQCSSTEDGVPCFGAFEGLNLTTSAQACASLQLGDDAASCSSACSDFLQQLRTSGGCCVETVWQTGFSQLVLGFDIQIAFDVCNVDNPAACISPISVVVPSTSETCTFSEFWSRLVEYGCSESVGQPYVDNIVNTDPVCTPIARHYASSCGRANDRFCLDILQGVFPIADSTQPAFVNPHLSNVTSACDYSSIASDGECPAACSSALEIAIEEFGCCINMFNNTDTQVLLPHINSDVMTICGVESPGVCESVLTVSGADKTANASVTLIGLCVLLLSALVSL